MSRQEKSKLIVDPEQIRQEAAKLGIDVPAEGGADRTRLACSLLFQAVSAITDATKEAPNHRGPNSPENTLDGIEMKGENECRGTTNMFLNAEWPRSHIHIPDLMFPAGLMVDRLLPKGVRIRTIRDFRVQSWTNSNYLLYGKRTDGIPPVPYCPQGYEKQRKDLKVVLEADNGSIIEIVGYKNGKQVVQILQNEGYLSAVLMKMRRKGNKEYKKGQVYRFDLPPVPRRTQQSWLNQDTGSSLNRFLEIVISMMAKLQHEFPRQHGLYDHGALSAGCSDFQLPKWEDLLDGGYMETDPEVPRERVKRGSQYAILPVAFRFANAAGETIGTGFFNQASPIDEACDTVYR